MLSIAAGMGPSWWGTQACTARPRSSLLCRDLSRRFTTAARLVAVPQPDMAGQLAHYAVGLGALWGCCHGHSVVCVPCVCLVP